jgi:hypothetical protein
MECNLEKSGRICRIILFRLLSAIGCQADYDDTFSNSDERVTKTKKYPHTQNIFL